MSNVLRKMYKNCWGKVSGNYGKLKFYYVQSCIKALNISLTLKPA